MSADFNGTTSKAENTTANIGTVTKATICAWALADGQGEISFGMIAAIAEDGQCMQLRHFNSASTMQFLAVFNGVAGSWTFPATDGQWNAIAISYDGTSITNNPVVRVNFQPVTATQIATPVGTLNVSGSGYCIGNLTNQTQTWDGMLQNVQIANYIFTSAADMDLALRSPGSVTVQIHIGLSTASDLNDMSGNALNATATALGDRTPNAPVDLVMPYRRFQPI